MIHIIDDRDYNPKALKVYYDLGAVTFGPDIHPDTQVLVVRLDPVTKDMIDSLPNLKVIAFNATGHDHVDIKYAFDKGIRIISLQGDPFTAEIPASSEHAFGLIISCFRKYGKAFSFVDVPQPRSTYRGQDLKGKSLGIIGYGRIGRKIEIYGKVFGMDVIAYDINTTQTLQSREYILRYADIILLSLPLNAQTRDSFGAKEFEVMKESAYLVNISRGDIIKKGALRKALWDNQIAGAAVDVTREDDREDLIGYAREHDDLIITNHIGGCTIDSSHMTELHIAEKVAKTLGDKTPINVE